MPEPLATSAGAARLDRWLFAVRLFRSRALAAQAVGGGRVQLNGTRVKPGHGVCAGDRVSFKRGAVEFECAVNAIPPRRGPAAAAARCYEESAASLARRAAWAARPPVAPVPRPRERPGKHQRALLRRLRGRI
jgi:ribosome-associated heat shock protein Hsp15